MAGFRGSVDFVVDNGLCDDLQVFVLSVLPGTDFRERHQQLGLRFSPDPPYPVESTLGFNEEQMLLALDYAEARMDMSLFPMPALDISLPDRPESDLTVNIGGETYLSMVSLYRKRPFQELETASHRLTHPYQILIFPDAANAAFMGRALERFTADNPYTPLEIIFLEPEILPQTGELLRYMKLARPHYLDQDLRFLFSKPGNRAVMFTMISEDLTPRFSGDMERQIHWWKSPMLPSIEQLQPRFDIHGILIDAPVSISDLMHWQDRFHQYSESITAITFSDRNLQNRWLRMSSPEEYYFPLREGIA
jgi:hypothetical protein